MQTKNSNLSLNARAIYMLVYISTSHILRNIHIILFSLNRHQTFIQYHLIWRPEYFVQHLLRAAFISTSSDKAHARWKQTKSYINTSVCSFYQIGYEVNHYLLSRLLHSLRHIMVGKTMHVLIPQYWITHWLKKCFSSSQAFNTWQTIIGEVPTDWLLKCLTLLIDDGCLNAPLVSVSAAHGANLMCVILKRALLQVQLIMKHVNYKFLKGEVMKDCFKWCDWSNQPKKEKKEKKSPK